MTQNKQERAILAKVATIVKAQAGKTAETFARLYYANVPLEDLNNTSAQELAASVLNIWEFAKTRTPGKPKIRIFTEKRKEDTKLLPQTIVEIINDDMPFLVDSVTGVINSLGYSINLVIHPVMQVERDKKHVLTHVEERSSRKSEQHYESFIHCDILDFLSPDKHEILLQKLEHALDDVRLAVSDWAAMCEKLREATHNLQQANVPSEYIAFCEWIADNHFTFLGFRDTFKKEGLGILRTQPLALPTDLKRYPEPLMLTKTTEKSDVHRQDLMDCIIIKHFDAKGNVVGLYQFMGLFTSVAYRRSVRDIPLLRQKIDYVLEKSGFAEDWHDGKALIHILESFPREELFQAPEEWLFETSMAILQLQNRQRLTLFIRPDQFERFVSCIVYIPRERYDSDLRRKIGNILQDRFQGHVTSWQVQLGELAFARVHYTLSLLGKIPTIDASSLEQAIRHAALTWEEDLQHALLKTVGEHKGLRLFEVYGHGFSKGYQEQASVLEATTDILEIEQALAKEHLHAYVDQHHAHLRLKIYSMGSPVSLSSILPILENMHLNVLSEIPFIVTRNDGVKIWIHKFTMETKDKILIDFPAVKDNFLGGIESLLRNEAENDGFNQLILKANFTWRECQLFRAYAKYLRLLQGTFSSSYMEETLAKYPDLTRLMCQLFVCQFAPASKLKRMDIINQINALTADIKILDEDRILRKFINAISATLRTNFYQTIDGQPKPYISFKIDCAAIEEMPLPRPKYEVFVYSSQIEAIHLRGAKVARGGIRWSDRREDFRTETLGLMKAQMVKNAVIIPSGSKGGFIVKQGTGIEAYQTMMRGLLDITDNLKNGKVITPEDVVCRDEDDAYLVVAADKGTSTFSDYANQIAEDYNFWLGDAFASGGATGYDHKKMGITSRGVWEAVKRHFQEMGQDVTREEVSVIGIGDMSGDVFGNGMLLSKHFKLLAAFNHKQIFIDPTPDPATSYKERQRLFKIAATWEHYNPKLISKGGGVFERNVRSIPISSQMKEVFDIAEDALPPPDLIRAILKASVDLMWLGGIGTYIKAHHETSLDVGDPANDGIRINGRDVHARVIAEGANLGVTQLGRIEYAKKGGRLNTDAIDNSAGVDCSDHEVNIKILLRQAKGLTFEKRNALLKEMTDDVAHLVLQDNFWQVQAISFAFSQGVRLLDEQSRLMRDLEAEGLLNRALEHLPDEAEIARRTADQQGLMRPELAVLLAYAKISLKKDLLNSSIPDRDILRQKLLSYFPERLQKKYAAEIEKHPLRREIITTLVTNTLINRLGITFVHEMKRQANVEVPAFVQAYYTVRDLLDLSSLWTYIDKLETHLQTTLMLRVQEAIQRFTEWFLRHKTPPQIKSQFTTIERGLSSLLPEAQKQALQARSRMLEQQGVPRILAERLTLLEPLVATPDIIVLAQDLKMDVKLVAKAYFALGDRLGFSWLLRAAHGLAGDTHWEQDATNALIEELYTQQRVLTKKVLVQGKLVTDAAEATLLDLKNAASVDFPMLVVMLRQLRLVS